MFFVIVACVLFTVLADETKTIEYEDTNDGTGNYRFRFMTSNGITREEIGRLVNIGDNNEHIVVEGSYSYTDPDGKVMFVKYTADENGYHILDANSEKDVPSKITPELGVPPVASLLGK